MSVIWRESSLDIFDARVRSLLYTEKKKKMENYHLNFVKQETKFKSRRRKSFEREKPMKIGERLNSIGN